MDSYEEALLDVGTVLSRYDEDNNYAVYGFGGEPIRRFYANHPSSSDDKSPLPSLSRMTSVVAQVQSESKEAEAPASTTPTDKVKETMQAATEVLEAVEAAEAEYPAPAGAEVRCAGADRTGRRGYSRRRCRGCTGYTRPPPHSVRNCFPRWISFAS